MKLKKCTYIIISITTIVLYLTVAALLYKDSLLKETYEELKDYKIAYQNTEVSDNTYVLKYNEWNLYQQHKLKYIVIIACSATSIVMLITIFYVKLFYENKFKLLYALILLISCIILSSLSVITIHTLKAHNIINNYAPQVIIHPKTHR